MRLLSATIFLLFCTVNVFSLNVTDTEGVIGVWNSGDMVYEIDVNFFIVYDAQVGLTEAPRFGTYMIGDGVLLVRYVDTSVFPDFFSYVLNGSQLVLTNQFSGEVISLTRREVMDIDGVWDLGIKRKQLLVLLSEYTGTALIKSGLIQGTLDNFQYLSGAIENWTCDTSGSVDLVPITDMTDLPKLFTPTMKSDPNLECSTDDNSIEIIATGLLSGVTITQSVTYSNKHDQSSFDGTYHLRIQNCNRWLKFESGFFREIITGNRLNCTSSSTFSVGIYEVLDEEITLTYFSPLGNIDNTYSFLITDNSTVIIDGLEYSNTSQVIRAFKLQIYEVNTTTVVVAPDSNLGNILGLLEDVVGGLVNVLLNIVGTVLTLITGPSGEIDIDKFDIIGLDGESMKRNQNREAYIVFHDSEENSDNLEQIGAENELEEESSQSTSSSSTTNVNSASTSVPDSSDENNNEDSDEQMSDNTSGDNEENTQDDGDDTENTGDDKGITEDGDDAEKSKDDGDDKEITTPVIVVETEEDSTNDQVLTPTTATDPEEFPITLVIIIAAVSATAVIVSIGFVIVYKFFTQRHRY